MTLEVTEGLQGKYGMKSGVGFFLRIYDSERFRIYKNDSAEQIEYVALQITTIIIDRVHTVENSIFREFILQSQFEQVRRGDSEYVHRFWSYFAI